MDNCSTANQLRCSFCGQDIMKSSHYTIGQTDTDMICDACIRKNYNIIGRGRVLKLATAEEWRRLETDMYQATLNTEGPLRARIEATRIVMELARQMRFAKRSPLNILLKSNKPESFAKMLESACQVAGLAVSSATKADISGGIKRLRNKGFKDKNIYMYGIIVVKDGPVSPNDFNIASFCPGPDALDLDALTPIELS